MSSSRGTDLSMSRYLPLYNAAVTGDWETAKTLFFDKDREEATAIISFDEETALHVAVQSGKANDFVKKLVELMPREALAMKDRYGYTALHSAAKVRNTEAAMAMVEKYPDLLYMLSGGDLLPVTTAATYCHKDTLEYLISASEPNVENSPFEGKLGMDLLITIITCEIFDVAMDLVEKFPDLARLSYGDRCALSFIAEMDTVFPSRESFSWWEKLIYRCIPIKQSQLKYAKATSTTSDIENVSGDTALARNKCSSSFQIIYGGKVGKKLQSIILNEMEHLVPRVKEVRRKKAMHKQALELVVYLCREMASLPEDEAWSMIGDSIIHAAEHGISEIVEVIMELYPVVTGFAGFKGRNIMHLAAANRFENVFNLTYNMSDRKHLFSNGVDSDGNNLMHICAKLAPSHRLNLVPGAALQMQRELQWFNEMEKFVPPSRRKWVNKDGKTPKMLFTEEHKELKAEGERWMKDTANACTIAAALIATVMFAAAFTVPGGVASETGIPIFLAKSALMLFAISDAISLFTSVTSLLMFLSILTSRYAEGDFLYVLPKRLSIGLFSLFVSITFMLAAFGSTLCLVFGKKAWFIIPVVAFACLPVASFVMLQFPLLADVVYSTYGPGIFSKKNDRFFY